MFSFHLLCCIEAIDPLTEKKSNLTLNRRYRKESERENWHSDPLDHIPEVVEKSESGIPPHDMDREDTRDDDRRKEHCEYDRACYRYCENCESMTR